jgi:hypothetical protein
MSDTILFGVLKMPYEMAMRDEISRMQFYQRVQELIVKVEAQPEQRPWVGLEIEEVQDSYNADYQAQTRAVEAKLKERNNG